MIKDENYVQVSGWMTKLGIKGNSLIAFACIYGFSQDGESEFTGSAQYIADWCGISRTAAFDVLSSLVKKGFIVRHDVVRNDVRFCNYRANFEGIKKLDIPGQETCVGSGQETCHHILSSYPSDNTSSSEKKPRQKQKPVFVPPTEIEVQEYVKEKALAINPKSFYDYYSELDWHDKEGNQVKSWKGKAVSWHTREVKSGNSKPFYHSAPKPETRLCPHCHVPLRGSACPQCYANFDMNGKEI
jgi:hypothetical protein